jgi:hypothetical protein
LKNEIQTSETLELKTQKEVSMKTLLNVVGIFIFSGLALTFFTKSYSSNEIKEFLLFIFGSAFIYYFLVNIYFLGAVGRKIFFVILILLSCFSIYMIFYLATNSTLH